MPQADGDQVSSEEIRDLRVEDRTHEISAGHHAICAATQDLGLSTGKSPRPDRGEALEVTVQRGLNQATRLNRLRQLVIDLEERQRESP
ncbi:hypothetical protein GYA93_17835 [Gordonia desulfuricans]|uniref:Uncharacterized protein n=1 Tax=Gordonia desulfuricans TaxID=89051 RepID=A0A7K3LT14_9ACTN|nr:hypothetical protein [Gordonia desulfuricans]NDK91424.1 hypothetical protein [Gordonia desulfuricans]